jgi:hypothetical protein
MDGQTDRQTYGWTVQWTVGRADTPHLTDRHTGTRTRLQAHGFGVRCGRTDTNTRLRPHLLGARTAVGAQAGGVAGVAAEVSGQLALAAASAGVLRCERRGVRDRGVKHRTWPRVFHGCSGGNASPEPVSGFKKPRAPRLLVYP